MISESSSEPGAMILNSPPRQMSSHDRKIARLEKKQTRTNAVRSGKPEAKIALFGNKPNADQERFASLLERKEDELLNFVANVNRLYQDLLHKNAPFMTFVLCGMQSAGKSTIMERFLNAVLNIVQDGTGTRCPLDTTCIHDSERDEPSCELTGPELESSGQNLSVEEVFRRIVNHNRRLGDEDRFSTEPLRLTYRSKDVQNMRFVDTPGIIATQSTGQDNREAIKEILRHEINKPNTKLCVLLEPNEFQNNAIVNFCDETFGNRDEWLEKATFLMTKFDKQLGDAKSGSKVNGFFKEFLKNKCYPHLVITPTLPMDSLPPDDLFQARRELLSGADDYEEKSFRIWRRSLKEFKAQNAGDEDLREEIAELVGFKRARNVMRTIMLKDIMERLPEVLMSLRADLESCEAEKQVLEQKRKMSSSHEVKLVANQMLFQVQKKLQSYLDGNMEVAETFPEHMQTLDDEIDEEEESDWKTKRMNHLSAKEDDWRNRIADLDPSEFIVEINPDKEFLGGKQYQRALEFFKVVMISALPDPTELQKHVAQATGFAQDGLQHENWERAMTQLVKTSLQGVSQPGVNYLIKHVGSIFRRLFAIALRDVKTGEVLSDRFNTLPPGVEKQMTTEYEDLVWELMENAARATHLSLEPMFSTIDPNIPTFNTQRDPEGDEEENEEDSSREHQSFMMSMVKGLWKNVSGAETKMQMRQASVERITTKKFFLPDQRASMITDDESKLIVARAFEYIIALFEFILSLLKFQLNHHLYQGFKEAIQGEMITRINNIHWEELVQKDESVEKRLEEIEEKIAGLKSSLQEVKKMERSF